MGSIRVTCGARVIFSKIWVTVLTISPKNDIIIASFRLHEHGLEPIGEPSFEQWEACGDFIHQSQKDMRFWVGDWLNYGERKWGERYKEALEKQSLIMACFETTNGLPHE